MTIQTVDDLQVKLRDLESFYMQRNQNMLAWRDLYFMRKEAVWFDENGLYVDPEPDEERIVLPVGYNVVEGFRELLLTKPPVISVPPPTVEGQMLVQAEHNERALFAIWDRAHIYERLVDSLWHGLVDGWGVLQVVWDASQMDESGSPIVVLHHDPYNVYALPGDVPDTWKYVIHAYPRLVGHIKEEWLSKVRDKRKRATRIAEDAFEGLKDTEEVTFIDYWDDTINAVALSFTADDGRGGTVLETRWIKEPTKHGYGFLPWEIYLPCRLPFRTVGERMGVGILYVIEEIVKYLSRLVSQKATMVGRYQDPPLVTKTELGPDFEPVRTERGMHLRLRIEEDAQYLQHPGPMPQIDSLSVQIAEQIEASSLPRALQGMYVGSISGIAMSLLRNPTLMKVAFRQAAIERAAESLNVKILKLLERKLTKPLYLWGRGPTGEGIDVMIDPDKISGYYRNEVKLSASLPTDDANTVNMLASLVQLQIISRQTARDVAQQTLHDLVPQSLIDEEERILAEMIWNDPGMIQSLAQAAAQKLQLAYLPKGENPRGGYGEKEVTMPAPTLPSQTPGMPGGNTQPSMTQRLQEMAQRIAPTGAISRLVEEKVQ